LAAQLREVLVGRPVVRVEVSRPTAGAPRPPAPGTNVDEVEAVGKHLLIRFGDGTTLRTHLQMNGRWQWYRNGEAWRRPRHRMRALVAVPDVEAVCFDAPIAVLERSPAVGHLGPDLCRDDADLDEVLSRLAALVEPDATLADVLLDQRIACGVGNVYKSEVCFAVGRHPATPIGRLDDAARRELFATAAAQLRANLGGGPRTTAGPAPGMLAVYGRARRSCRRCGTPIEVGRIGSSARSTCWCPTCQPLEPPG
jgi:endonuclease-8